MYNLLIACILLLLISGKALAGLEYDTCLQAEKKLKAQETHDCSGLSYLLNPNACFATRKMLKEFAGDKCKKIGIVENVDFSVPKVIPEKKSTRATINTQTKPEPELPLQKNTIDLLREENATLKNEVLRLKAEIEQLRKTGR